MKQSRAWISNSIAAACLFVLAATVWAGMGGGITQPPNVTYATGLLSVTHGGTGNTTGYASGVPAAGVSGVLATSQGGTGASSYAACVGNACPLVYYNGSTFATDPSRHISYDAASDVLYTNTIAAASSVTVAGNLTVTGTCTGCGTTTANSEIKVRGDNGFGSVCNKIRRYSTTDINTGSDITYTDSAASGAIFYINTSGIYAISHTDNFNVPENFGITYGNTSAASCATALTAVAASSVLAAATSPAANQSGSPAWVGYIASGTTISAQSNGDPAGSATNLQLFTITRVR